MRGVDIQNAAQRLANHLGIQDFRCHDGWLWRFRNQAITGELLSADSSAVEEEEEDGEATGEQQGLSLAAGLEAISTCLRLIGNVGEPLAEYYKVLCIMRMKVLKL